MINIIQNDNTSSYDSLPQSIRKQYGLLDFEMQNLESKAASSDLVYSFFSWEQAIWHEIKESNPMIALRTDPEFDNKTTNQDRLSYFLEAQLGRLLWASYCRINKKKVFTKYCEISRKNYEILESFNYHDQYEYIGSDHKYVHSSFLEYLSPRNSEKKVIDSLLSLQKQNTTMNCESFLLLALISIGLISPYHAQIALFAVSLSQNYSFLYQLLCLEKALNMNDSDQKDIIDNGSALVFECNDSHGTQVSHVAIFNDKNIYELGFGKIEDEFRVMKTPLEHYMPSVQHRSKYAFFLPIPNLHPQEKISVIEEYVLRESCIQNITGVRFFDDNFNERMRQRRLLADVAAVSEQDTNVIDLPQAMLF